VQKNQYQNTSKLRDDIRNAILNLSDLKLTESKDTELFRMFSLSNVVRMQINDTSKFKQGFKSILDYDEAIKKRVEELTKNMKTNLFVSCKQSIVQKLGCQARCPVCGAKCSKPDPHENEEVEVWQDPCKTCPQNNCTCQHPDPISVKTHESTHHLAGAFYGRTYHKLNTPYLQLCYQRWKTAGIFIPKHSSLDTLQDEKSEDEGELIFPQAKYYNMEHPAWYNDITKQSTEGVRCKESIPPLDQRRAWMVVRHTLVNHYKHAMIDHTEYDKKLYPMNVDPLPADYEPKWEDVDFE
jgi:hypothetical protein